MENNFESLNLPEVPTDLIGKKIVLKPTDDANRISVWGTDPYIFDISFKNMDLVLNKRIRLFPVEEYPNGSVHIMGAMVGYERICEIFQLFKDDEK